MKYSLDEIEKFVKKQLQTNSHSIRATVYENQLIPDERTYVEYASDLDDAFESFWNYKIGFLRQHESTVPELYVPFISRETDVDFLKPHEQLFVIIKNKNLADLFSSFCDADFASSVIDRIEKGDLNVRFRLAGTNKYNENLTDEELGKLIGKDDKKE